MLKYICRYRFRYIIDTKIGTIRDTNAGTYHVKDTNIQMVRIQKQIQI